MIAKNANQPKVRTVLGDIPAVDLGVCYAHEHIIIDEGCVTRHYPDFHLGDVDRAVAELKRFYAAGGRAMVDSMPCDCGRNVHKLCEVSRQSKVHIVCPTGIHLRKYYPPEHWTDGKSAAAIARYLIDDIEQGVDFNDYRGNDVCRSDARAGIIKVAGGQDTLSAFEKTVFEAAAIAHLETGAPILTHTEQGTAALEQIEWLCQHGVPVERIVLSHTDRQPDPAYHREILSSGVFVEYDSAFRWTGKQGNPTLALILTLLEQGMGAQIMLGMDAARRSYWQSYGGSPGLTYLLDTFWPQLLQAGLSHAVFEQFFIHNPARAFAF